MAGLFCDAESLSSDRILPSVFEKENIAALARFRQQFRNRMLFMSRGPIRWGLSICVCDCNVGTML